VGLVDWISGATDTKNEFQADPYKVNQNSYIDPNAAANKANLEASNAARQGMAGPQAQAASVDMGQLGAIGAQGDQTRGQQSALAGLLMQQAQGQGPSVAEMHMRRGLDSAIASQRAQAASARGVSPGLAQRMAAQGIAGMQQQAVGDSAMLRANEQMAARNGLGGLLAGMRGQDQAGAQFLGQGLMQNAGMQQGANLANLQAALQSQGQKDQMAQFYTGAGLGVDAQSFAGQQAYDQARQNAHNAGQGINAGVAAGNQQVNQAIAGGLAGAAGAGIGWLASDERLKTNVDRGDGVDGDIKNFLGKLEPVAWDYKDEKFGKGRHYGFMAQDAEHSTLGKLLVENTSEGKMINTHKALAAALASAGHLNRRLEKLEGK
jgi:endosialidase-like protein